MDEFYRITRLPPYVFTIVNDLKSKARAQGEDIIDLGMGNPDLGTPKHIVDKLCEAAKNPRNHRYSASKGITRLRKAVTTWYARRQGGYGASGAGGPAAGGWGPRPQPHLSDSLLLGGHRRRRSALGAARAGG